MRGWEQDFAEVGTGAVAPAPAASTGSDSTLAPLTAFDRCDSCGAQAYVRALLPHSGELLFCGHHGHAYKATLLELGARVRDDSYLLAPTP